ncbi:MAG: M23 family metallopeptidase [Cytophagales bacterium]
MAKVKFYYDTETCKYEKIKTKPLDVLINFGAFVLLTVLLALGLNYFYSHLFDTKREARIRKENEELLLKYELLSQDLTHLNKVLNDLQKRDDNIYRVVFEAEPIPNSVRSAGVGGVERYKDILEKDIDNKNVLISTSQKMDLLKKKLYIQSKSYDELLKMAQNKQLMLASIPAIRPIKTTDLNSLASGFGMRIHPIYKVKKMHTGVDFTARLGTPVYAAGDGKVITSGNSGTGYGNEIEINHGFGFVTKYAHLSGFKVRVGQKVKRGETIGFVGNTGTSVSPHLHYEVIKNGIKVNPINYFYNDLTPEEYQKLIEISSVENQSLGGH